MRLEKYCLAWDKAQSAENTTQRGSLQLWSQWYSWLRKCLKLQLTFCNCSTAFWVAKRISLKTLTNRAHKEPLSHLNPKAASTALSTWFPPTPLALSRLSQLPWQASCLSPHPRGSLGSQAEQPQALLDRDAQRSPWTLLQYMPWRGNSRNVYGEHVITALIVNPWAAPGMLLCWFCHPRNLLEALQVYVQESSKLLAKQQHLGFAARSQVPSNTAEIALNLLEYIASNNLVFLTYTRVLCQLTCPGN